MTLFEIMDRVARGMSKEEADALLEKQVEEVVALGDSREEALRVIRANIGYCAGYYSREVADRAYDLFDTEHPIFGRRHPSPKEAFELGKAYGEAARERSKTS